MATTPAKAWLIIAVGEAAGLELDSDTLDMVVSTASVVLGVTEATSVVSVASV